MKMKMTAKIATGIALLGLAAPAFATDPAIAAEFSQVSHHKKPAVKKAEKSHGRHAMKHTRARARKAAAAPSTTPAK